MIIASICYIYDVLIYRVIHKTMLKLMLLDKNLEMPLVGCGLATSSAATVFVSEHVYLSRVWAKGPIIVRALADIKSLWRRVMPLQEVAFPLGRLCRGQ